MKVSMDWNPTVWSFSATFILSDFNLYLLSCCPFRKNKHQIQSYTTFNMDDSKLIYTLVAYFSINGRFCPLSLGNPTFSNMFPRARHVLMTFELWTLCARLHIFSLYILICSCHLSKNPSQWELFWYLNPDDGYWNRNVNIDFTS